jgi:hypothetical protein
VGVERGQRFVEEQHGRIARQRPGERDALALAARELADTRAAQLADAEALQELIRLRPVPRAEAHVPEHVEVREERVLLEQVADAAMLGRDVAAPLGVEQYYLVDADRSRLRPQQAGNDAERRGLAGARRSDQRERLAALDRQLGRRDEGAKRVSEPEAKRHLVRNLTDNRTSALTTISSALIASATSKSRSNCS